MTRQQIGDLIQKRRVFLQLTQEDLAEMATLSPKTIYCLEHGIGNPGMETLQKVLEIVGLEISVKIKGVE